MRKAKHSRKDDGKKRCGKTQSTTKSQANVKHRDGRQANGQNILFDSDDI